MTSSPSFMAASRPMNRSYSRQVSLAFSFVQDVGMVQQFCLTRLAAIRAPTP